MRFLIAAVVKDLRRQLRDPLALVLWVGIPLAIGGMIFLAFGGDDAGPSGTLLVVDEDQTLASTVLTGIYQRGPLADIVTIEEVTADEGRRRIDAGQASGLLTIDEGFGAAVLDAEPFELRLVRNPAQRIVPGIIEESLSLVVESTFYLQRLFEEPLDLIAATVGDDADAVPDSTIATVSVAFNQIVDRTRPYLLPPVIDLETITPEEEAPFDFARLFFPSMLFMALLFMAQGLSADLWRERAQGTLRRILASPQRISSFLLGKLVTGAALMMVVVAAGLIAGRWIFGIALDQLPLALVWTTVAGVLLLAIMMSVQLFATSERAGSILTGAAIFPLAMLGGSFFPFEVMPSWLAEIGVFTPNGWALAKTNAIFAGQMSARELAPAVGLAALLVAAILGLSIARIRRRFARG